MNDEEPTVSRPLPDAGSDSAATSEFDAVPSSAPRPRSRARASAAGSALASRTAGWMVAAALAGSLVTLLLTGQLHSAQLGSVRPAADQRSANSSQRTAAKTRGLAAPAPRAASASARQLPVAVRPGRVAYRSGQPGKALPRTCRLRPAARIRAGGPPVAVPARLKVLVPRACRLALPAPAFAGLPGRGRIHVLPRRAYRVALPAPLPRRTYRVAVPAPLPRRAYRLTAPHAVIGRVPAPGIACLYAGPPPIRAKAIRLHGARRLVIIRGYPAKGGRVSVVPAPRRVRFSIGAARRAIVRGKPVPAGRTVILRPAPRLAGHRWLRVVTIKGHRAVISMIAPGRSRMVRQVCVMAPRRVRQP